MSTVVSKPGQLPLCTMQSPAPAALVHALVNFASHFVSFAGSGGRPFENPLAITPHLQATFLPIAFVTPPSHFEAASALPAAPVRKSTATAIDSLRMFSILPLVWPNPKWTHHRPTRCSSSSIFFYGGSYRVPIPAAALTPKGAPARGK